MTLINMELLREWLQLDGRKRNLKAELEEIQDRLAQINESVQQEFVDAGVDSIRIDGRTVYMACDRWPRAKGNDKPALIQALRANGYAQYVKEDFNTQSLRGLTNEFIRIKLSELTDAEKVAFSANDAIPEHLQPFLEVTEVFTVKSRKG